jgi:RNA polymerase sigma factor (sigma-70 family)
MRSLGEKTSGAIPPLPALEIHLEIATRPPQPRSGDVVFQSSALARELEDFLETLMTYRSLRQVCTWRVPPNWSPRDWFEEMEAEANAAAWEAELEYDPTRGVPLEAFVHQRVWARARTRYRREWTYVLRCGFHLEGNDRDDVNVNGYSSVEVSESLCRFLDRLSALDRKLIVSLYWEGKTESEVAQMFSISRQAVNKRKWRIVEQLRYGMGQLEKKEVIREFRL